MGHEIKETIFPQHYNRAGANETTVGGFTRLHHEAAMGHKDVVDEILLVGKLKVEVATSDGITALHVAAYGALETNVLGRTALHYAVQ